MKVIILTFDEKYHAILENFSDLKKESVEEVVEEAVVNFFAMLIRLPIDALKNPDHFGFQDFLKDCDCATELGL
jgi:hypothetical protein